MWEAIESNRRRTWVIVIGMAALLVALGIVIGESLGPGGGGVIGALGAAFIWFILWMVALLQGDRIMLLVAGAKKIEKHDAPQLFNVVEEMTIASGLGRMPDIYLIPDDTPNAFAAGRKPESRVVAVTSGLLRILNRDELQGVVAHEMGHHKNRDISFMILMGVMLGAIVLIADLFLRGTLHGGRRSSSKGGGHPILIILSVVLMILAPALAHLMYFACSRRREYLADASGARFTRYPEGLASALEKISCHFTARRDANRVLAPMYIINPMQALAAVGLFSTHPPTDNRVRILRGMGGGAGYVDYEAAYLKVTRSLQPCIGKRTLAADTPLPIRAAAAVAQDDPVARSREAVELLARVENLTLMSCLCGVGIRIPQGLKRDSVPCPRCGRQNEIPEAQAEGGYKRQGTGWESFRCSCGAGVQLHPMFSGTRKKCTVCNRSIEITS
jgi:heat shock protein HtpX